MDDDAWLCFLPDPRALVPNCYTKNKFSLNMVGCFLSLACTWAALWTTSTEEMILVPDTDTNADTMDRISYTSNIDGTSDMMPFWCMHYSGLVLLVLTVQFKL